MLSSVFPGLNHEEEKMNEMMLPVIVIALVVGFFLWKVIAMPFNASRSRKALEEMNQRQKEEK